MTPRGRLLIVEDDVDIRETLAEVFEEEGYEVARAANGREALVLLGVRPLPVVILLDLMMPVMDGWQLHAELQKVVDLATIPLIVLSADGQVEKAASFRGAGHLRKPPDIVELLAMVERMCVAVEPSADPLGPTR